MKQEPLEIVVGRVVHDLNASIRNFEVAQTLLPEQPSELRELFEESLKQLKKAKVLISTEIGVRLEEIIKGKETLNRIGGNEDGNDNRSAD